MKTIGIIILLTIFLTGAYLLGEYKDTAPYKRKIDSLQYMTHNQLSEIKRLKVTIDSSKKALILVSAKVPASAKLKHMKNKKG